MTVRRRAPDPLYRELARRLKAKGYFERDPAGYARKAAIQVAIFTASYVGLLVWTHPLVVIALLVTCAQMTAQMGYLAHDAGHGAVTGNRRWIRVIGHFGMTFITGFSFGWWMHSHDNHHSVLNERDEDLAMKYSLVLAVHPDAVGSRRGLARRLLRHQAIYVWLLLPFYHFAMMADGLAWMARHPRTTRTDQACFALYLVLYFVVPSLIIGPVWALVHWVAVSMIGSIYIGLTFIVHHIGRKVWLPEEAPTLLAQQLEATRTIRTWRIFDFYYCGLNDHIEHHLFHWVPSWRYRHMRADVQAFCREHGLAYREQRFRDAIASVYRYLRALGRGEPAHLGER